MKKKSTVLILCQNYIQICKLQFSAVRQKQINCDESILKMSIIILTHYVLVNEASMEDTDKASFELHSCINGIIIIDYISIPELPERGAWMSEYSY